MKTESKRVHVFKVLENECIWMKAGVINFRLCDNAYDCYTCRFDRAMKKAMTSTSHTTETTEPPAWVTALQKRYHGSERPCRHALTGRVNAPKVCPMDYQCYHCPYDQMLDEMDLEPALERPRSKKVDGFSVADGLYYHMGHAWARFEHGGRVRVGFDDFMVRLFGIAHELNLPPLGADLRQNEPALSFRRDIHQAAVLSPITGKVLCTNHKALDHPGIVNADPYASGWLLILEPDNPKYDLKGLLFAEEGYRWMGLEARKLMFLLGEEYQQMVSTGGEVVNDIFGMLPQLQWERLARTFLKTESR